MNGMTALEIKELNKKALMDIPGVVGVGMSRGSGERINIYVESMSSDILGRIPQTLDGFPVTVINAGRIVALPLLSSQIPKALMEEREQKMRPSLCGISIGNMSITAGTQGAIFRDNTTGKRVILSNAHVLTPDPSKGSADETRIVQPGVADGGTEADIIANLTRYKTISTLFPNKADCAIATPLNDADISDEIMEIGTPVGISTAEFGQDVQKSGRTTGLNSDTIIDTSADVNVGYSGGWEATFTDCYVTGHMADGGDSGSALLDMNNNIVGLLFAGSANLTVHVKIQNVMDALNISLTGEGPAPPPSPQLAGMGWLALGIGGAYLLNKLFGRKK